MLLSQRCVRYDNRRCESSRVTLPTFFFNFSISTVLPGKTFVIFCLLFFFLGYGYITPQTSDGQLLCIFVCLMGIPLSLLTLKSLGQLVAHRIRTAVATFERKVLNRQDVKHVKTKSAVILFFIMVSSIIVYSRLLMRSQNWTFVQGVYFCFVSFSTIGFGDFFVSANQPIPLKQLVVKSSNASKIYLVNSSKGAALKGARCILYALLVMLALCIVSSVLNSVMAAIEELKYINYYCLICFHRKIHNRDNDEPINNTRNLEVDKPNLDEGNLGLQGIITGKTESEAMEEANEEL